MYKELGNNIPKSLQYDCGMGLSFIFCLDTTVDIKEICIYPTYIIKPMYILTHLNI